MLIPLIPPALGGAITLTAYRGAALYTIRYLNTKRGFQMLGGETAFAIGYVGSVAFNQTMKAKQRRQKRKENR